MLTGGEAQGGSHREVLEVRVSPGNFRDFWQFTAVDNRVQYSSENSQLALWPFMIVNDIAPFHGGNTGSNPVGDANENNNLEATRQPKTPCTESVRKSCAVYFAANMSTMPKKVLRWGGGLLTPILAGYVVARISGIPPSEVAAVLWTHASEAVRSVAAWLMGLAHVSHLGLMLLLALTAGLAFIIAKWRCEPLEIHSVPADFDPTELQRFVLVRMLKLYDMPLSMSDLNQQTAALTTTVGGRAYLEREMEDLELASVVRKHHGLYYLTRQGRDWMLDQIEHEIADFKPSETQRLAATVLIERYPKPLLVKDIRAGMEEITELSTLLAPLGEIAREMEDLMRRSVVKISSARSEMACCSLTVPGRNFMLKVLGDQ